MGNRGRNLVSLIVAAAVVTAVAAPSALAALDFAAPITKPMGNRPGRGIGVGNFDGDSDPDLAVANRSSDNVTVRLGTAGADFGGRTHYAMGDAPDAMAIADFNGDSDPDIAVTGPVTPFPVTQGYVAIRPGGAGGTFGAKTAVNAPNNPSSIAAGDFNGDNDPDIAVVSPSANTVQVRLGGAGVSFGAATNYTTRASPRWVAIGDFNGDNDPDLAVANFTDGSVSVLLGGAGGTFGAKTDFLAGGGARTVATGNFNGDSDPDLAVANAGPDTVSILLGGAGGSFAEVSETPAVDGAWVAVGNLNADSFPDLAMANLGGTMDVLRGQPGGALRPPASFPAGDGPQAVALGNFDGDGDTDAAVTNQNGDAVSILRNTSTPAAEVGFQPASLDFGAQMVNTPSPSKAVKITNVGDANLRIDSVGVGGTDFGDFEVTNQDCVGFLLVPGDDCVARVTFTPTERLARSALLRVRSNAPGSPHTAPLNGIGSVPYCRTEPATIIGTEGADSLEGTPERDVVHLLGGDDLYNDSGGPTGPRSGDGDWVCGGSGDDTLVGNDLELDDTGGDDFIFGGSGDDELFGLEGDDFLRGGADDDVLDGGTDFGGADFDQCFGDSGRDAASECESIQDIEF